MRGRPGLYSGAAVPPAPDPKFDLKLSVDRAPRASTITSGRRDRRRRLRHRGHPPRLQAGAAAAFRLVQSARRLRQPAAARHPAGRRDGGFGRQSRRRGGLRGARARRQGEDLRADGVVAGQDRADPRLRGGAWGATHASPPWRQAPDPVQRGLSAPTMRGE